MRRTCLSFTQTILAIVQSVDIVNRQEAGVPWLRMLVAAHTGPTDPMLVNLLAPCNLKIFHAVVSRKESKSL